MFVLKKIIASFLMPVPIGLFLLILSLIFLLKNSYKKAKIFLFLSFFWFALISNQTISNMIISPLENSHKALINTPNDAKYILVLGNGHKTNENFAITSELNTTAINRLVEGIRHYKNLKESNKKSPIGTGIKKAAIIFFNKNIYSPIIADVYPTTLVLSFEISALVQ